MRKSKTRFVKGAFLLAVYLAAGPCWAEDQQYGPYIYSRPKWYTWIIQSPVDMRDYAVETFRVENTVPILAVVGSTALLIWKDQWLVDQAHALGDKLHISHTSHQQSIVSVPVAGQTVAIQGPYDTGSGLYFIGDGWVDLWLAGGFVIGGVTTGSNRAFNTASEIGESVLASGVIVQLLKHVTGRESPYVATEPGGNWVPFPNQITYHENVPHYDAFPSGHLAAGLATVTVIADNYPEHRYVRPVGYTLLTVLGFQMMNNGVHWASDYPLGLALGYGFAKIAVRKGRTLAPVKTARGTETDVRPTWVGSAPGLALHVRFDATGSKN